MKKFDDASRWLLKEWISTLAKGGGAKRKISMLCESKTLPINSCTFEQFKDIQEIMLLILHCKTMYCVTERVYRVHLRRGERESMRSHETKDRAIQEYLETPSKNSILVQFEARSRERLAILPDTVTCSRSLRYTACSLH